MNIYLIWKFEKSVIISNKQVIVTNMIRIQNWLIKPIFALLYINIDVVCYNKTKLYIKYMYDIQDKTIQL